MIFMCLCATTTVSSRSSLWIARCVADENAFPEPFHCPMSHHVGIVAFFSVPFNNRHLWNFMWTWICSSLFFWCVCHAKTNNQSPSLIDFYQFSIERGQLLFCLSIGCRLALNGGWGVSGMQFVSLNWDVTGSLHIYLNCLDEKNCRLAARGE